MSRHLSRSTLALGALALGALLIGGATAASSAPAVVSTVSGNAVVRGTGAPATGGTLEVYTQFKNGDQWYDADVQRVTIGADGTYSFDLAYATNYYALFEPDANWNPPAEFATPYNSAFIPTWFTFAAIPGDPVTCSVEAVPTSTWVKVTEGASVRWDGLESLATCDNPDAWYVPTERFWSPKFDNAHFFTTNLEESWSIRNNDRNWLYEGTAFYTLAARDDQTCAAGSPVYRFYSSRFQSHFYTKDAAEKAHIIANDRNWTYEGVAYCAYDQQGTGTTPLYRFWSPRFGKHFYTANEAEKNQLVNHDPNWTYENIAYYVVAP